MVAPVGERLARLRRERELQQPLAAIDTLGAKYDAKFLRRLGEWCVFPLELFTLGVILLGSHSAVAWILLICYALVEIQRALFVLMNDDEMTLREMAG